MLDLAFIKHGDDGFDDIRAVLFHGIVTAGKRVGVGPVVVDSKTAAKIDIPHGGPFFHKLFIQPARLHRPCADVADIGDLRTDMVVEELQAIEHIFFFESVQHCYHMTHGKPKDTGFTARFRPFTFRLGGKLYS